MKALFNFLFQDVKSKTETKDFAVLLRFMCLILAIYYLITAVTVACNRHYYVGLILVLAIAICCGAFACTYEDYTKLSMILINIVLVVFPAMLSFAVGYDLDFQFMTFFTILIVFYNQSENMTPKIIYTILICIASLIISWLSTSFGVSGLDSSFSVIFTRSINIIATVGLLSAIAYCYCTKFNQAEQKLRAFNKELEIMANYDPLTKLSNRRHMNEHLAGLVYEHNRTGLPFTMAIGDIDFFKKVNDTYGHDTGDYVLSTVAGIFSEYMKGKGHVARWGGEEFLFVFENMGIEKAFAALDKMRHQIEMTPMRFKDFDFNVTMTYGMEEFNDLFGIEVTLKHADDKLYAGKQGGRNRVVM